MFRSRTLSRNVSDLFCQARSRHFSHRPQLNPLKILFCGADDFSIHSLRAVKALQEKKPECIDSIDVVCRPDKRVGRGLKKVQEVPIKSIARELELPIHAIDTFTGWSPPKPVDLVVAVSFGLLVPARILDGATHGGLNVHPSLLPDLRGPAPIQHALLKGRSHTGVTLQTMHPTRFDHGKILAQTPQPGIAISQESTVDSLIQELGMIGSQILTEAIEKGLFLSETSLVSNQSGDLIEHAPNIMPADRKIDWSTWTADRIMRYDRVLGKLWDDTTYALCKDSEHPKRVIYDGPWREVSPDNGIRVDRAGYISLLNESDSGGVILTLRTADGRFVSPSSVTIQGQPKSRGLATLIMG